MLDTTLTQFYSTNTAFDQVTANVPFAFIALFRACGATLLFTITAGLYKGAFYAEKGAAEFAILCAPVAKFKFAFAARDNAAIIAGANVLFTSRTLFETRFTKQFLAFYTSLQIGTFRTKTSLTALTKRKTFIAHLRPAHAAVVNVTRATQFFAYTAFHYTIFAVKCAAVFAKNIIPTGTLSTESIPAAVTLAHD